jgi:hypothetical protein
VRRERRIANVGGTAATELRHHTKTVELANGFLNRFVLIGCRRVRLLPEGGDPDALHGTGLDRQLKATLQQARTAGTRSAVAGVAASADRAAAA